MTATAPDLAPAPETPSPKGVDLRPLHASSRVAARTPLKQFPMPIDDFDPAIPNALPVAAGHSLQTKGVVKTSLPWSSALGYYPVARAMGYIFDPYYKVMVQGLAHDMGQNTGRVAKVAAAYNRMTSLLPGVKNQTLMGRAERFVNGIEFLAFGSLALTHFVLSRRDLKDTLSLSVDAERGTPEDRQHRVSDLWKSNNLLVQGELQRYWVQTALRLGSAGFFLFGLRPGIVGNALMITGERTFLYSPNAGDILKEAVNTAQLNNLRDPLTHSTLVNKLITVMQKARLDSKQPLVTVEEVDTLRPVLEKIATDVVDKRIGVKGMFYVMGGGVIVVDDPARTMKNYEFVRDYGVSGIAAMGAVRNGHRTTWAQQVRNGTTVAESAQDSVLVDQHRELISRGPIHSGINVDSGRQGGVSLGVGARL